MKRFLYFLTDRLQITYYERISVLTLGGLFILLLTINQLYKPAVAFSEEDYAEVIADFHARLELRESERQELLARYYPEAEPSAVAEAEITSVDSPDSGPARLQGASRSPAQEQTVQQASPASTPAVLSAETASEKNTAESDNLVSADNLTESAAVVTPTSVASDSKININTADTDELVQLPGIGPAIAARIIEYRNEFGPFEEISEIKNVRGIGQARFDAIKDYITTGKDD
ncbi:comEA protein [Cyclonatronum proteinivorum]|uniref:ComEA protein n=1 Tax=Cyclonatronum proteinivorum TaxID=1457365 RepID=A0A345UGN3_9BACT|nr:ComEA family DNA-binding protein [Cyclonatronum proteinivorum]AXI99634.1 comEA protein [Cyclonatronum proteinivorum]